MALLLISTLTADAQRVHVDKKHGFTVRPPAGWNLVPSKVEEKWIVAKWLSSKKYEDHKTYVSHNPLMKVIVFPKDALEKTESGSSGGTELKPGTVIDLSKPYKDYKDYLKRNFQGGGFFISSEQERKVGKTPVTLLEVKIEKLVRSPRRIWAWVYKAGWGEIAIECDALEIHHEKVQPLVFGAFRTFRLITRDPKLQGDSGIETGAKLKIVDTSKMTPAEIKKARQKAQAAQFKKAVADLPSGWTHKRSRNFLILNHARPKFQDKVIAHAEAVRMWLDRTFGKVGKGYVQGVVIRICKDRDEERAFNRGSGDAWSAETREIVLSENNDSSKQYEFQYLGRAVMRSWFYDKNSDLWSNMPVWLSNGLSNYVGTATLKGRSLDFAPDSSERDTMREGRRKDKLVPLRKLVQMTGRDMWTGKDAWYLDAETASMMRYLFGPMRRNRKLGRLITDYIANLLAVIEENEKAARESVKKSSAGKELTEEEEEARFKEAKKKDWSKKEKDFLKQVFDKTFKGWTDRHWAAFQAGYDNFVK